MNLNKILTTLTVIFICVASVFGAKILRGSLLKPFDRNAARAIGPADAQVLIVEHIDYQCHTCKEAANKLELYQTDYPGIIRLEVRFHYFDTRPAGRKAALYAECASHQDKFWPLHKILFDRQESWAQAPNPETLFYGYAKELGLANEKFEKCVDDLETLKTVKAERDNGTLLGVQYTPTFFINGKMTVGPEGLEREIQSQLPRREL